jgi:hypothetical protein
MLFSGVLIIAASATRTSKEQAIRPEHEPGAVVAGDVVLFIAFAGIEPDSRDAGQTKQDHRARTQA